MVFSLANICIEKKKNEENFKNDCIKLYEWFIRLFEDVKMRLHDKVLKMISDSLMELADRTVMSWIWRHR